MIRRSDGAKLTYDQIVAERDALVARVKTQEAVIAIDIREYTKLEKRIDELETARDRLLSACQDSDDACYGTLSTTFVQHCFAQQRSGDGNG